MIRLATLFLLLGGGLLAAAEPPQKAFPFPYDQHDLENGLRIVTIPTPFPNIVAVYIVVQTGSRNEVEPGRSGFAHLFEHMMFKGTKENPPEKWEATMKQIGAATNAYTSDDLTAYHATFSKEDLEDVLKLEADRFQNLEYSEAVFRTETRAVLGEYNKNTAAPTQKLFETIRNTAYDKSTYKHTTMGFLEDIKNMPELFDYSREFFDRYYRPEYTTIIVAGDVQPENVRRLVAKYWGQWERGNYKPDIPQEPPQQGPREDKVLWPSPTLPWVTVSFKAPAYSDTSKDKAALTLLSYLGFSPTSELHQRLVISEQKVDTLFVYSPDTVDPSLFSVFARVKKQEDMDYVRQAIDETFALFKDSLVDPARLDAVKSNLKYGFALRMRDTEAVAQAATRFVALRRTPETINRLYSLFMTISPKDVRSVARKYFSDNSRTVVTLVSEVSR
jgi:zinc protease